MFRGVDGRWKAFVVRGGGLNGGVLELTDVDVGLMNDEAVEILPGGKLASGDQVVLAPETSLEDKQRVTATPRETTPVVPPLGGD
ncbi:MAG: hypothetical protein QM811_22440 [Pirellulales bacterium]